MEYNKIANENTFDVPKFPTYGYVTKYNTVNISQVIAKMQETDDLVKITRLAKRIINAKETNKKIESHEYKIKSVIEKLKKNDVIKKGSYTNVCMIGNFITNEFSYFMECGKAGKRYPLGLAGAVLNRLYEQGYGTIRFTRNKEKVLYFI